MARLPVSGSDNGTWGDILNDFLGVAHNADGTLKPIGDSGVSSLSQSKITNLVADLAATEKTANKAQANGYASLDASTHVPTAQLGSGTANASSFLRGDGSWAAASDSTATHYRGVWAPSTAYGVNDVVTHHGEGTYLVTSAHTSGSTFTLANKVRLNARARTYDVMDYGVVADNTTDVTAAINAVIAQAVADGIADGTYFARIHFPPGTYVLSSPTTKGGATQGNAQITLPVISTTNRKFVLVLSGTENGSAFAHWEQTTGQRSGVVLRSTLTSQTIDGTWGVPSILGGPTVAQGTGTFSNMNLVVDGITLMAPHDPTFIAWDLRYVAQVVILSASALANAGVAGGAPTLGGNPPTSDQSIGLRLPNNLNNDCTIIVDFSCEGFYYGCWVGEHLAALRIALIYCQVGILVYDIGGASFHGATISNLSVEATPIHIQAINSNGGSFPLNIEGMHTETGTTWNVDDINNNFTGTINWSNIANAAPLIRGAANLKIVSNNQMSAPGAKTAPGVPATTVALQNPFWRDCAVSVSGGTVSAIAVAGTATGLTSGTVIVPSGKTITLTYSSAPTWTWVAL